MVAPEPFRGAALKPGGLPEPAPQNMDVNPSRLSVREIRELLSSLDEPDVNLLSVLSRDRRISVRRLAYRHWTRGGDLASNEDIFRDGEVRYVAGADEAGRGALAGPIVAAAVMFEPGVVVEGVADSKTLTPSRREELYEVILESAESVSVAYVDSGLIDRWGIQAANMKALGDAVMGLDHRRQFVICDHFSLSGCGVPVFGLPGADATFQSVAAAGIVAKVERDRVMVAIHNRVPLYNFTENKGYGTEEHLRAIKENGPSAFHRRTFGGVLPGDEDAGLFGQ